MSKTKYSQYKTDEIKIRRNTKKIKQYHEDIKQLFAEFGI